MISVHQASETEGLEFQMEFALRPEIKLGQYKGIHVKCPSVDLTEAEKQAAIDAAAAQNTVHKSVDRPAQLGDIAVIDFTAYPLTAAQARTIPCPWAPAPLSPALRSSW